MDADVVVIGAGTVGAAIGYGLAKRNARVIVLDGGDHDIRAAAANFGLIWVQGKGMDMPSYQRLTRDSANLWADFAGELEDLSELNLEYERNGGLVFCIGEEEFEQQHAMLLRLQNQSGGAKPDWEMLDRSSLARLLPNAPLGRDVSGASLGRSDGHVNPLMLLAALHVGIQRKGGRLRRCSTVESVRTDGRGGFSIAFGSERVTADRVVIAAGLNSKSLAAQVGLDVPIQPQRGQILVTERLEPFLPLPTEGLRQTRDGTVMIGATHEDSGLDTSATSAATTSLSARAIRTIPALSQARLVRQWGGLRILTPDSYPIYAESQTHPGAFVTLCHSGVTLAAVHAKHIADAVIAGRLPPSLDAFHQRRFDLPSAA